MQICASLNHRKKMKAKSNRLIHLKPVENLLELLTAVQFRLYSVLYSLQSSGVQMGGANAAMAPGIQGKGASKE